MVLLSTMAAPSARNATGPAPNVATDPRVRQALANLGASADATTDEQVRITQIPAPPFHESVRATYLAKLFTDAHLHVTVDEIGNVVGERAGTAGDDVVMIAAHLDTVFPAGTDVHVRRDGGRLYAPGISDNGTGLAALVAIARAMRDANLRTRSTILFVANVGEEGEGNLRGMRKLMETYRARLRYVIALDGSGTDYATTAALASRRVEMTVTGPGGHSWSDFGAPNPIHALARGIARFVNTPVPDSPRTSFNVGEVEGGTSVNSIPAAATIKVDLRSESETELAKLETALRQAIKSGVDEEIATSKTRGYYAAKPLSIDTKILGIRPAGELPTDSPLLAALRSADDYLGNQSREERSSTDANIPLSLGLPAISIGAGGQGAGAHTASEWFQPEGRELALRRILLLLYLILQTQ